MTTVLKHRMIVDTVEIADIISGLEARLATGSLTSEELERIQRTHLRYTELLRELLPEVSK
jgi:hypothetical protein